MSKMKIKICDICGAVSSTKSCARCKKHDALVETLTQFRAINGSATAIILEAMLVTLELPDKHFEDFKAMYDELLPKFSIAELEADLGTGGVQVFLDAVAVSLGLDEWIKKNYGNILMGAYT